MMWSLLLRRIIICWILTHWMLSFLKIKNFLQQHKVLLLKRHMKDCQLGHSLFSVSTKTNLLAISARVNTVHNVSHFLLPLRPRSSNCPMRHYSPAGGTSIRLHLNSHTQELLCAATTPRWHVWGRWRPWKSPLTVHGSKSPIVPGLMRHML